MKNEDLTPGLYAGLYIDLDMEDLKSSKRNRNVSYARVIISYLAVNQLGRNASEVA